jgi:hypothetical protein
MNAEFGLRIAEFDKRKIDTKLKKRSKHAPCQCPKP